MRILVLTFYYPPDLSAGSFRAGSLVESLSCTVPPGSEIDVITTQPNRYESFTALPAETERHPGVSVFRLHIPSHRSRFLDQSRAFASFFRGATTVAKRKQYDLVFATSSRLMTAALGARVARAGGAKLYLDIRDIFVETIGDVLPRRLRFVAPAFNLLERWAIGRAAKVNLVSPGFAGYFEPRYPRQRFSYFTNGIDDEFLDAGSSRSPAIARDTGRPIEVVYAGNIGEGQGLHGIVPDLARRMGGAVRFTVIGDGGRRRALEEAVSAGRLTNVRLRSPLAREELIGAYQAADVLFLHLNDYPAFKRVLPSKIFEYAALGKPIWAGVAGYAAEFVKSEIDNSAVFRPCDLEDAIAAFSRIRIGDAPRASFVARFGRRRISDTMAGDIVSVAAER